MSKQVVQWSEIIAECGRYRDGFVAIFRKYEGQPTDEKDGRGRVFVTQESFARQLGIAPRTFSRWCNSASAAGMPRSKNDLTRDVQRAARHEPDAVVAGIMAAPAELRERIFHDLKMERAGIDTSPANRKAAQARGREAAQPIYTAIARTGLTLCVQALVDAKELLEEAIAEGALDGAAMDQIGRAHDDFAITLAEARFVVSA